MTESQCRKVLILGGVRSGKSRCGESLAVKSGLNKVFIATAEAGDNEMSDRIAAHQRDRGTGWTTVGAPLTLSDAIATRTTNEAVVVDCLTLWLTNIVLAGHGVSAGISELAAAVSKAACPPILVSNEVGMGIVPATSLGCEFRIGKGF